jgi:hypothetical protein
MYRRSIWSTPAQERCAPWHSISGGAKHGGLFSEVSRTIAIGQMAVEPPSHTSLLLKSDFGNGAAVVSPDRHWIAYNSNLSGRYEIYVERYPQFGNRQTISTGGGRLPLWSRDGRELFFGSLDGRQMFAVPVRAGTTFDPGRPQVLFELAMLPVQRAARPYDIAPDGRFVVIRSDQANVVGGTASNLILVRNWFEELKRLVPPK